MPQEQQKDKEPFPEKNPDIQNKKEIFRILNLNGDEQLPTTARGLEALIELKLEQERVRHEELKQSNLNMSIMYFQQIVQAGVPPHLIPYIFMSSGDYNQMQQQIQSLAQQQMRPYSQSLQPISERYNWLNAQSYPGFTAMSRSDKEMDIFKKPGTNMGPQGRTPIPPMGVLKMDYQQDPGAQQAQSSTSQSMERKPSEDGSITVSPPPAKRRKQPSFSSTGSISSRGGHKRSQSASATTTHTLGSPYNYNPKLNLGAAEMNFPLRYQHMGVPIPPLASSVPASNPMMPSQPQLQQQQQPDMRYYQTPQMNMQPTMSPHAYATIYGSNPIFHTPQYPTKNSSKGMN